MNTGTPTPVLYTYSPRVARERSMLSERRKHFGRGFCGKIPENAGVMGPSPRNIQGLQPRTIGHWIRF